MDWTDAELQKIVDDHSIVLFMKGTPGSLNVAFPTERHKSYNNLEKNLQP